MLRVRRIVLTPECPQKQAKQMRSESNLAEAFSPLTFLRFCRAAAAVLNSQDAASTGGEGRRLKA